MKCSEIILHTNTPGIMVNFKIKKSMKQNRNIKTLTFSPLSWTNSNKHKLGGITPTGLQCWVSLAYLDNWTPCGGCVVSPGLLLFDN